MKKVIKNEARARNIRGMVTQISDETRAIKEKKESKPFKRMIWLFGIYVGLTLLVLSFFGCKGIESHYNSKNVQYQLPEGFERIDAKEADKIYKFGKDFSKRVKYFFDVIVGDLNNDNIDDLVIPWYLQEEDKELTFLSIHIGKKDGFDSRPDIQPFFVLHDVVYNDKSYSRFRLREINLQDVDNDGEIDIFFRHRITGLDFDTYEMFKINAKNTDYYGVNLLGFRYLSSDDESPKTLDLTGDTIEELTGRVNGKFYVLCWNGNKYTENKELAQEMDDTFNEMRDVIVSTSDKSKKEKELNGIYARNPKAFTVSAMEMGGDDIKKEVTSLLVEQVYSPLVKSQVESAIVNASVGNLGGTIGNLMCAYIVERQASNMIRMFSDDAPNMSSYDAPKAGGSYSNPEPEKIRVGFTDVDSDLLTEQEKRWNVITEDRAQEVQRQQEERDKRNK